AELQEQILTGLQETQVFGLGVGRGLGESFNLLDPTLAQVSAIDEKTKRQAIEIKEDVTNREISAGKNPMGLAATVLYISCIKTGENITQRNIAQAAGITDVTLRNTFKDLMNKLELN